jgi:hypothetical protein
MKRWTLPLVLGTVGLVALAAGFGVSRAMAATLMHRTSPDTQSGGVGLDRMMSDPSAMKAMQPLHAEHLKDMQAWQAQYGTDPQSVEAQAALKTMRKEHVREMQAAFKKLGIKVPVKACDVGMMDGTTGTGMMDGTTGTGMMGGADGTGMMDGGTDSMMGSSGVTGDVHAQHHGEGTAAATGASTMMGGSATSGMMGGTF